VDLSLATSLPPWLMNRSGLSRRMLRHLFYPRQIACGSRVVDVGCRSGRLVEFLDEMSFEVVGIDSRPDTILRARRKRPGLDLRCASPQERLPVPEQSVDLVLARDLPEYEMSLFSPEAFQATAHLLSLVRPGGELVIVSRVAPSWSSLPYGHLRGCYARHLGYFGSRIQVATIADSLLSRSTWRWIRGQQPLWGYVTASFVVPEEPRSTETWEQMAAAASWKASCGCCEWSSLKEAATRRAA
jgi:SAM-dependent methyltransferase